MKSQSTRSMSAEDRPVPASARVYGGRLLAARVAWVALAVLAVGLFLIAVPSAFDRLQSVCAAAPCADRQPTPDTVRALREAGLSLRFYAAYFAAFNVATTFVWWTVGAIIFWRRSDELMALFVSLFLMLWGASIYGSPTGVLATVHPAFWLPVKVVYFLGQLSLPLLFYLFPDGRWVPRWTRHLAAVWALLVGASTFLPGSFLGQDARPAWLDAAVLLPLTGALVYSQIRRYRRVSGPVERQQTKWVVFGLSVAVLGFAGIMALALILRVPVRESGSVFDLVGSGAIYLFFLAVPLSIGVAILRYHLFDIDLVVNRALAYGALTACVVGIYVLIVGYLGALLKTDGNLLVSLAATGVVAVLFAPLRDRLQRGVNRLMYGERDDPYAVLSRLGERLEATLEPRAVLPAVAETIAQALKLPYAAIELRRQDGFETAAEYGAPTNESFVLPLAYQRETVGQLLLAARTGEEGFSEADRRLLDDLARQAGVAAHAVRLTVDLQRARGRLVSAREEERRRLRRDLHDGLGPQLSSQTLTIDAVRALMRRDPESAEELLIDLKTQAQDAITDIRRLVHALRPPALDDLGLSGALRQTAARYGQYGLAASVEASEPLPTLPAAVEVAAYRIAGEALTNVARHAGASECAVGLSLDGATKALVLEIRDNGWGIPEDRSAGVGLHSMRERAEEIGGSLVVRALPEGGTCVRARLPLAEEG